MLCWSVVLFFFFNDTATTEIYTSFPTRRSSDLLVRHAAGHLPQLGEALGQAALPGQALHLGQVGEEHEPAAEDRKSTRLNSSHSQISYAVFCLKKKTKIRRDNQYSRSNTVR